MYKIQWAIFDGEYCGKWHDCFGAVFATSTEAANWLFNFQEDYLEDVRLQIVKIM
jgi:hypothetical protein